RFRCFRSSTISSAARSCSTVMPSHINIGRRVFDSQTPGLLQLGTVWLPLPHLVMIPLLLSDSLWQSGLAGAIPSVIAYVLGTVGVFRLARGLLPSELGNGSVARVSAWMAAFVYAANPNLIYLQTTAMTESIYLALFVWAAVYFAESVRAIRSDWPEKGAPLFRCSLCLAAAELTRYDGWFLAAAAGAIVSLLAIQRWQVRALRRSALIFLVLIAAPPLLWLAYNAAVYGNPLEFANGPYSAKAILQRSAALNPSEHHAVTAARYFLKSAELNMAPGAWGRLWLATTAAALAFALRKRASVSPFLLLCLPIAFYGFSIAHGGVPLYVPTWWPFSSYNVRYGLQLLPLFAVSAGIVIGALLTAGKRLRPWLAAAAFALAVFSYAAVWRLQPLCLTEARVNSRTRTALESAVDRTVAAFPPNSRFLTYLGDHVGVFQQVGIPLRQVVNEGNHRPWKKPADPSGLWERALTDPPQYVDYVIAFDGDAVDRAADRTHLTLLNEIHTTGQPRARIYSAKPSGR
ncbi:MAG TPA: hypothetical protein VGV35_14975, partial [Bryobacteraceae bacterium]|nr:hypothetical protein [Bryobacteraceae bacterium]